MRRLAAVFVLLLAATGCLSSARQPTVEDRAAAVAGRVWSPYCAGRILTECSTAQADELRGEITRRLRAGESEAQVLAWLSDNYGREVLAAPETDPAGLVVWVMPAAILAAGAIIVGGLIVGWRRRGSTSPVAPPATPSEAEAASSDAATPADLEAWRARVREQVEREL